MVQIREILCPTDFSEASRHALEHATSIARWYQARITAMYVRHAPLLALPPFAAAAVAEAPPYEALEAELHSWLEPAAQAGIRTAHVIADGDAAGAIIEQAANRPANLIALGTHGRSGFERFMLGSVAEKVLRKAPCPVLTVPPAVVATGKMPYTRILCAVDFSNASLAALRLAASLAGEANASLTILHVFDMPLDDDMLLARFDVDEFRRVVETQAQARLESLVDDDMRVWCVPSTKLAYGKPYREILEVAAKDAMDLIVLGVHGRNPLNLALFGSTTSHVVRHASCPVLTLRS